MKEPRALQTSHHIHAATHSPPANGLPSLLPWPLATVMAAAFLVVVPFFFLGNPSGHDFEFHMFSWMEVVGQWKAGILYPHWASLSHWAYGEARFLFYPPASWTLGGLLGLFLPWAVAPAVYIWIALTAAGTSMFLVARRWMPRSAAIFAAAFYAANPYHWVIVYWRSAFAELLASCLLPLVLLLVLRLAEERSYRSIIPLALVITAAWLTNGPSAVMVNYSVALLATVVAIMTRKFRVLTMAAAAVALGAALSSFYLLPAAYEQRWVNIGDVLSPGVRPQDNFLFTLLTDDDHNRFNRLVSIVAVADLVVIGAALALGKLRSATSARLWWSSVVWASAIGLLLFPFTLQLWEHLPKLEFVQLPWRWLLCLNFVCALWIPLSFRRWWTRAAVCAAFAFVLLGVWLHVQPPWWDSAQDIAEMHDSLQDGTGYEGTDEYVPLGVDPYELSKDAPRVVLESAPQASVAIADWSAQRKAFAVSSDRAVTARLRLFNYPAWQAAVDGQTVATDTQPTTGEIIVNVPAGHHDVVATFGRTWDRTAGAILSLLAAAFVGAWTLRRPSLAKAPPMQQAA